LNSFDERTVGQFVKNYIISFEFISFVSLTAYVYGTVPQRVDIEFVVVRACSMMCESAKR